nr:unnamed protein product [Digitaria exilis]
MAPDLMTVADGVLDCGVCFLPLKPPIFQCDVGHVLCSPCHEKVKVAGKCHVCRVAMPGGYRRCHAMERVVEGIRAACPNAPYGCAATPPYYGREEHLGACPHAPCHCPGEACGFKGSTAALRDHIVSAHGWPVEVEPSSRSEFDVRLSDGFNFVVSYYDDLFLLNFTRHPFCRTMSVVCICPRKGAADAEQQRLELELFIKYDDFRVFDHDQRTRFQVAYSDLSDGLPDSNDYHQLIVLNKYVHGDDEDMEVSVDIYQEADCFD